MSHLRRAVSPGGYLNCGCPKSYFSINALFLCEVGGKGRWMVDLSYKVPSTYEIKLNLKMT